MLAIPESLWSSSFCIVFFSCQHNLQTRSQKHIKQDANQFSLIGKFSDLQDIVIFPLLPPFSNNLHAIANWKTPPEKKKKKTL
jgi:hypothetical protein